MIRQFMSLRVQNLLKFLSQSFRKAGRVICAMKRQQEPDCEASHDTKAPKFDQVTGANARGFRKCAILVVYSGAGYCGMQR